MSKEMEKQTRLSIIILNWNGWLDTIECLESVLKSSYQDYTILLIDNFSQDDSIHRIREWINGNQSEKIKTNFPEYVMPCTPKPLSYLEVELKNGTLSEALPSDIPRIIFIKSDENLGFAIANNVGINLAINTLKSSYVFLLNNDTVIPVEAIGNAIEIFDNNSGIGVVQSVQYSYYNKNQLVHAGGDIKFWGQYKYYRQIKPCEIKKIQFASGCALFIRASVITKYGALSEKFFFGEEDFEFSLRMKKNHVNIVCPAESVVYHKISVSSKKIMENFPRSVVIYSLNRIINMKDYYPKIIWFAWKKVVLLYFTGLLIFHYKQSISISIKVMLISRQYSNLINDIQKKNVDKILKEVETKIHEKKLS